MHMRERRRLLARPLPSYAYLPGRFPHPVRDPDGHSHHPAENAAPSDPEAFAWGMDLFNHGYYWEAHEAWEDLWRAAKREDPWRSVLKALILVAAAGVKLREGKRDAARRHGGRAVLLLRASSSCGERVARATGWRPAELAARIEAAVEASSASLPEDIVFAFVLGGA